MQLKKIILMILPIMASSCAIFGPSYEKPVVETPQTWQSHPTNVQFVESGVNLSDMSWWNRFNDEKLNELINQALENNNDIQTAIGNITSAAAQLQQVKMNWVPTVSLGGSASFGSTFNSSTSSSNPAISSSSNILGANNNFNFYSAGLIPSYSINIFQQLKQQDAAKANLALATTNKDAVRLTVISQLTASYFTLLALNEQLEQQTELSTNLSKLLELVKVQYQYGLANINDVQNYQQKISEAKMQIPGIKQNIVVTQNALQVLVNRTTYKITSNHKFTAINTNGIIPANLPSTVLNNRPDIRMAEEQLKIANANIGVATTNFFPKINLTTPIGGYNAQLGNLFSSSGDFWTAQIMAVMPILNLSLYSLITQAKGQYYVAYYNYVKTTKSAFADVNNSLSGYEQTQQTYKEANVYYDTVSSTSKLNTLNYKNGYISYPASLSSQIANNNAKIILIQTKLQELQSIIALYQSLAGGYNYKNSDKPKKFDNSLDA
ncbi:MAG: efflux transporter outer membrane subunit [Proteobacteria bacterium]|jgi:NodT family efflux transporter outer membrane factor (OMF) lipoprotein|nr:efflux transporter outer membrane subunit [Pseudomonadota bacterium]